MALTFFSVCIVPNLPEGLAPQSVLLFGVVRIRWNALFGARICPRVNKYSSQPHIDGYVSTTLVRNHTALIFGGLWDVSKAMVMDMVVF